DLTNQDIARTNLGTDIDNACFVEFVQRSFTHVGDVCGDLFSTQLGIPGDTGQLLDMDGGETIFLNHALGQADGVFEVEAVPRHERDAHVLTQRQLTHVGGRAVSHDVAARHLITPLYQRTLVDAGVLVGAGVLGQVVDIDTGFACFDFVIVDTHHDAASVDGVDHTTTTGHDANAGVTSNVALHAGTHQRLVGTQGRHSLTLHVRTHEGAVGVVVLEERNQRSSNRDNLLGRDVHQGDVFRCLHGKF